MAELLYDRTFACNKVQAVEPRPAERRGDRSDPADYVVPEQAELAVNVALATGRPILLRGASGMGKSSLARAVAHRIGWGFVETVITSRSQALDLLYRVDDLRRLRDAQARDPQVGEMRRYLEPGPLFWGFSPATARELLRETQREGMVPTGVGEEKPGMVVLIDEIDKADPDFPNNLLRPLGDLAFDVPPLSRPISADRVPLVFVTTNEERDLPQAFLRRCVQVRLARPDWETLERIATRRLASLQLELKPERLNGLIDRLRETAINTAEFLDLVVVAAQLTPEGDAIRELDRIVWSEGVTADRHR